MKKLTLILLGIVLSTAYAVPNYWSNTFAQGFLIYNLTNENGQSILITCDSGFSDEGNKHSLVIYDETYDAWNTFYQDKKVEFLIDDTVYYVPKDINTTSGSNDWENLMRAIQEAQEMDVYVEDKIFGKFKPKNSKKELSLDSCSFAPDTFPKNNDNIASQSNKQVYEIPFQQSFVQDGYYEYVGSQILRGKFQYTQSDMDGDVFELIVDQESLGKLPSKVALNRSQFFLNHINIENASEYLGIDIDWRDNKFNDGNCTVEGPMTVQVTGVNFDEPSDYHWYASITPNILFQAGPFKLNCQRK